MSREKKRLLPASLASATSNTSADSLLLLSCSIIVTKVPKVNHTLIFRSPVITVGGLYFTGKPQEWNMAVHGWFLYNKGYKTLSALLSF
jgi:hypothetical protein